MHNRKWEEIRGEKSGRENEGCEEPTRKEVSKDVTLYAGEEKQQVLEGSGLKEER